MILGQNLTYDKIDIIWKLSSHWSQRYKSQLHTTFLDWDMRHCGVHVYTYLFLKSVHFSCSLQELVAKVLLVLLRFFKWRLHTEQLILWLSDRTNTHTHRNTHTHTHTHTNTHTHTHTPHTHTHTHTQTHTHVHTCTYVHSNTRKHIWPAHTHTLLQTVDVTSFNVLSILFLVVLKKTNLSNSLIIPLSKCFMFHSRYLCVSVSVW